MTPLAVCPEPQVLLDLASNRLSADQLEPILEHLALCPLCTERVRDLPSADTLTGVMRKLSTFGEDADAPLINEVVQRVAQRLASSGSLTAEGSPCGLDTDVAACLAPPRGPDELGWLGSYRVLRVLGSGGMGTVFEAEDTQLQRRVALKVMRPGLAAKPRARQRFLREGRAAAGVAHDHIATVYQVGEDRDVPYLAMQFLEGVSLATLLEKAGRLTTAQVLTIGRQTANGLAAAHARGLVHRDIKPANLWLEALPGSPSGELRVKILDFGLAYLGEENERLTQPGTLLGTPEYMAPEQAKSQVVDGRADLFSLGCVLYELTTGSTPFEGETTMEVLTYLATSTPAAPRALRPDVPEALSALIVRLLEKEPANRPASAAEVERALTEMAQPGAARKRRFGGLIAAAAAVLLLGMVLWPILSNRFDRSDKAPSTSVQSSPFDRFQTQDIPEAARFDGQPKELVGVLGGYDALERTEVQAVSSDGKFMVTWKAGSSTSLVDLTSGKESPVPVPSMDIKGVQFVNGNKTLAVYSGRGHWFYDVPSLEKRTLDGYKIDNAFTVFSPDGKNAAGVVDDHVHVWNLDSGDKLFSAPIEPKQRHLCHYDGKTVLVVQWLEGQRAYHLRVWDVAFGQKRPRIIATAHGYCFAADCNTILAKAEDGSWRLWDLGADRERFRIPAGVEVGTVKATEPLFSPDGRTLAMVLVDGPGLGLVDVAQGKLARLKGHTMPVLGREFSADGTRLVTWEDSRVNVWNVADGKIVYQWTPTAPIANALFTADGRHLIVNIYNGPAYILRLTSS